MGSKRAGGSSWSTTLTMGGLFGFFAYATYDLTNLATLRNWPLGLSLIDMAWGRKDAPKVTLVGKGVCFDTGGLDLKPSSGMLIMKKDMGGAANVLALAQMIMDAKLKVRLRVLIPAVENSVAGNAFRPLDIFPSRKGVNHALPAFPALALLGALYLPYVRHVSATEAGRDIVFLHEIQAGPASRSYGIQVARLAGMPAAVVNHARHALAALEGQQTASREQVDLFAPPPAAMDTGPSAAEAALAALDPDALSPREALEALYELKRLSA